MHGLLNSDYDGARIGTFCVSSRLEPAQISVTRNRRSARLQFELRG
jgi:hypothetical protein